MNEAARVAFRPRARSLACSAAAGLATAALIAACSPKEPKDEHANDQAGDHASEDPDPGAAPAERASGDESAGHEEADQPVSASELEPLDAEAIGAALGEEVNATDDGVLRATWPRTEVPVRVDDLPFPPAAGLTSWAGFTPVAEGGAMLMGDTVVFQDEVSPAMDAAFAHDLEVTALHNHFFFDEPKVYFMHIGGQGDPEELAQGVKAVWGAIRQLRSERPQPASTFADEAPEAGGELDGAAIGEIIGEEPSVNGEVVKVSIGREAAMHRTRFSGSMGLSSWAAFTGSDELAAMDGDFAMTADEVQPVLRALRQADIHVVALHNHMVGEEPAYYFTHFWGKGEAAELARGFRAALDAQR